DGIRDVHVTGVQTCALPISLTMAMTGQIDIGRGAAPFGRDLVEQGAIRIVARGSEVADRANLTVRVCVANLETLANSDVVARFMQGYRDTIEWMYTSDDALLLYEEFSRIPVRLMRSAREEYFPEATMWPDEVKGLDLVLADAL